VPILGEQAQFPSTPTTQTSNINMISNSNNSSKHNKSEEDNVSNSEEVGGELYGSKSAQCTLKCKKIFRGKRAVASAHTHMMEGVCFMFIWTIWSDL